MGAVPEGAIDDRRVLARVPYPYLPAATVETMSAASSMSRPAGAGAGAPT